MKCQSCGKKDATVKYYENINGKKQTLYFCTNCAKNMGFTDFPSLSDFSNLTNLFSPIFSTIPEFDLLEEKKCKKCGYTLDDYANTGMLGCENCYETFGRNLDDLLYKMHGRNRHKFQERREEKKSIEEDKKSEFLKKSKKEKEIDKLKEKLNQLVKEEKYEEAAKVRDEIKAKKESR